MLEVGSVGALLQADRANIIVVDSNIFFNEMRILNPKFFCDKEIIKTIKGTDKLTAPDC
jgi:hypothetical protein